MATKERIRKERRPPKLRPALGNGGRPFDRLAPADQAQIHAKAVEYLAYAIMMRARGYI